MKNNMEKKTKRIPRWVIGTLVGLGIPAALLAIWIANSPLLWGTRMADAWTSMRATLIVIGFVITVIAGIATMFGVAMMYDRPKHAGRIVGVSAVVSLVAFVLMLPVVPGSPARSAYRAGFDAKRAFAAELVETSKDRPAYQVRLNSKMAENILRASLQDTVAWIAEDAQPQYSVANGEAAWCVGLLAQHRVPMASDRVYTKGAMCLQEKSMKTIRADWDVRVPSSQGAYSTNLHKYVARLQRGLSIAEADIRFYIENNKPHMLAPVTELVADGLSARRVTAGFVTVDPAGKLELHTSAKAGEWPVPVVAYSTAEQIRQSANTRAGYYCNSRLKSPKCVKRNQPVEDTSSIDGAGGAADPNAGNATEFVLRRADGRLVMVTPLTPYGNSRNIVAYLEVVVDEFAKGKTPQATLYRVTPEASGIAIAQAVTAAYTADIAWTSEVTEPEAQKSASRIFEITPASVGEVVATIGTATNPEYLLVVKPQLTDGSLQFGYCIYEYHSGTKLDCRTSTQPASRIGTLRGVDTDEDTTGTPSQAPVVIEGDLKLADLNDEELAKLGVAVIEELNRRAKSK